MLIDDFLEPKILIVSGKGGVGKTTVAAALAMVAARSGRKVCLAEVDLKGTLPALFGGDALGYEPRELSPDVWGLNINPQDALTEYLRVQYHMSRISWVFTSTHFLDFITTGAPGLKDILILGKIWYLEQGRGTSHDFDTIIVDAPAAGHMLTFLSAPAGLGDAVRVGPVQRQAQWLNDMLRDPKRARIHLVTLAEEMPVEETLETSKALTDRLEINQGSVFANAIYSALFEPDEAQEFEKIKKENGVSDLMSEASSVGLRLDAEDLDALDGYARFLEARRAIQSGYLEKLRKHAGEQVIELPFLFSAGLALPDIETLADVIEERVVKSERS
jgi:anion-transporting  ArsA/GET3 family ATPase